jgi:hypothetical protein
MCFKLYPKRLLPRASRRRPVDVDTLRSGIESAPVSLIFPCDEVTTPSSTTRSDLNQRELEDQSRTSSGQEELRCVASSNALQIMGRKKPNHKERANRRKVTAEVHALQQAAFKRHGRHKAGANLLVHRMRPAEMNVESPVSVLGTGKVDPFRSYPADADLREYWLIDYCKSFSFL